MLLILAVLIARQVTILPPAGLRNVCLAVAVPFRHLVPLVANYVLLDKHHFLAHLFAHPVLLARILHNLILGVYVVFQGFILHPPVRQRVRLAMLVSGRMLDPLSVISVLSVPIHTMVR